MNGAHAALFFVEVNYLSCKHGLQSKRRLESKEAESAPKVGSTTDIIMSSLSAEIFQVLLPSDPA